jgi:hypothetical protein
VFWIMSSPFKSSTCIAVALAASAGAAAALAQSGFMSDRFGLGLKARADPFAVPAALMPVDDSAQLWQSVRPPEFALIGGVRDAPRLGLRAVESYGGIEYTTAGGWGSTLEAGFARDTPDSARRYSLGGQMRTALVNGRSWSVGLKYRVLDAESGVRPGTWSEGPAAQAYTLAPLHTSGTAFSSSYQLQMSYQYSSASAFGLAVGREIETFTPYLDASGAGRQLTFMGQHWLTPSWALSYDVLTSDPANPLRLQGVGLRLGVRYRF